MLSNGVDLGQIALRSGQLAASLTDFKGTADGRGDENAGRVALLRAVASRLP